MNKRIKKIWCEALRSGDYEQETGQLKIDEGFCCLGVLTDLYLIEKGLTWENLISNYFLEGNIINWAELKTKNPIIDDVGLSVLNDNGTSFKEIARLIEENL